MAEGSGHVGADLGSRLGIGCTRDAGVGYEAHSRAERLLVYDLRHGSRQQLATKHGHPTFRSLLHPHLAGIFGIQIAARVPLNSPRAGGLAGLRYPVPVALTVLSGARVLSAMRLTRVSKPKELAEPAVPAAQLFPPPMLHSSGNGWIRGRHDPAARCSPDSRVRS